MLRVAWEKLWECLFSINSESSRSNTPTDYTNSRSMHYGEQRANKMMTHIFFNVAFIPQSSL